MSPPWAYDPATIPDARPISSPRCRPRDAARGTHAIECGPPFPAAAGAGRLADVIHLLRSRFGAPAATILLAAGLLPADGHATAPSLHVARPGDGTRLAITVAPELPAGAELRLIPDDLARPESAGEIRFAGEIYLPTNADVPRPDLPGSVYAFLHRLRSTEGWDLAMSFPPHARGRWQLNGAFARRAGAIAPAVVVPSAALLPGENILHVAGWALPPPLLFYRHRLDRTDGDPVRVALAPHVPGGRVELRAGAALDAPLLASATFAAAPAAVEAPAAEPARLDQRERLIAAAVATGKNLLRARVPAGDARCADGFYLVYDATHGAWRVPHWIWAWGPAIRLLLDLERALPPDADAPRAEFRAAAIAAGRRSLEFEVTDPEHPAHGLSRVRWELSPDTPEGTIEYASAADSLFLAGWAWIPLHRLTGDERFLAHARDLVAGTQRLMGQYPVVPQDWVTERRRWTPHTLDESAFGLVGFRELYADTGDASVRETGGRFMDSLREHMRRDGCFLQRGWLRDEDRGFWDPDVKGHLWVLEGYVDAWQLTGRNRYRDLALALADRIAAAQGADGSWGHLFVVPDDATPRDERAIAIGAWLFYRLHALTGDARHLATARRALTWCLDHQYLGADPDLYGAIPRDAGMAYLGPRRLTVLYATTFFGLALLEELKLPPPSAARP